MYEIDQLTSGWVLRRGDGTAIVEFPTESQAMRAAIAVCRDEGVGRLRICRSGGFVEYVDPLDIGFETLGV